MSIWESIKKNIGHIVLILVFIFIMLFKKYTFILAVAGIVTVLVILFFNPKPEDPPYYHKSKIIRMIADSTIGKDIGLLKPEQIKYSVVEGRPNMDVGEVNDDYFTWTYLDDAGSWVGILARTFIDDKHPDPFVRDLSPEIQSLGPQDILALAERYVLGTGEQKHINALMQKYNVDSQVALGRKLAGLSPDAKKKGK